MTRYIDLVDNSLDHDTNYTLFIVLYDRTQFVSYPSYKWLRNMMFEKKNSQKIFYPHSFS
jgi:hypothetical protein